MIRGRIDGVFRVDPAPAERGGHGEQDRPGEPAGSGEPHWEVVDWKTGPPPSAPEQARTAAVQLAVYRLAWARLNGVDVDRVTAAFFYASTGSTRRPVDLLDADGLLELISTAVD